MNHDPAVNKQLSEGKKIRNGLLWTAATGFTGVASEPPIFLLKKGAIGKAIKIYLLITFIGVPILGTALYFMFKGHNPEVSHLIPMAVVIIVVAMLVLISPVLIMAGMASLVNRNRPSQPTNKRDL